MKRKIHDRQFQYPAKQKPRSRPLTDAELARAAERDARLHAIELAKIDKSRRAGGKRKRLALAAAVQGDARAIADQAAEVAAVALSTVSRLTYDPASASVTNQALLRAQITAIIQDNINNVPRWLAQIEAEHGAGAALAAVIKLAEYALPKLARTEHTGTGGQPITVQLSKDEASL